MLVADDDFFNLDVMKSFARQLEMEFLPARNGEEAVEIVKNNLADIHTVFLYCEMPIMNGFEACVVIREIMKKTNVSCPTYLVSEIERKGSVMAGFDGQIEKPFTFEMLKNIFSIIMQDEDICVPMGCYTFLSFFLLNYYVIEK